MPGTLKVVLVCAFSVPVIAILLIRASILSKTKVHAHVSRTDVSVATPTEFVTSEGTVFKETWDTVPDEAPTAKTDAALDEPKSKGSPASSDTMPGDMPRRGSATESQSCQEIEARLTDGLHKLAQLPLEQLRDPGVLAQLVRSVGLLREKRPVYGNETQYQLSVNQKGLYQLPEQFACALIRLSHLSISSFAEIGQYTGWHTKADVSSGDAGWTSVFLVAYLQRFAAPKALQSAATAAQKRDLRTTCVKDLFKSLGHRFEPMKKGGQFAALPSKIDLCFIDGDHHYDGIHKDVRSLETRCKYIMLHDVYDRDCPAVVLQWNRLKLESGGQRWECIQQPEGLRKSQRRHGVGRIGIGIIQMLPGEKLHPMPPHPNCAIVDMGLPYGLHELERLPLDQLRDHNLLAKLIQTVGLVNDYRYLYGEDNRYMLPVKDKGLYQVPDQLACALIRLSHLNVSSFVEIGTFGGWTAVFTVAYLRRFAEHKLTSASMDITDLRSNCVKGLFTQVHHRFVLKQQGGFASVRLPPIIDVCFIDGDHSYKGVHDDVILMKNRCRYTMLHDMYDVDCQGVVIQWNELKKTYRGTPRWECIQQPTGLTVPRLGIGIIRTNIGDDANVS
jgi:hypothetical protein